MGVQIGSCLEARHIGAGFGKLGREGGGWIIFECNVTPEEIERIVNMTKKLFFFSY